MQHVADAHGFAEIQRRSRHRQYLAGFQIVGVGGGKFIGKNLKRLVGDVAIAFALEGDIGMVGMLAMVGLPASVAR
jgi:hypothetical protein